MCSAKASCPRKRTKLEAGCIIINKAMVEVQERHSGSLGQDTDHGEVNRHEINFKGNSGKIQWRTG